MAVEEQGMGRKEEEQEDAYLKRMHVHRCVEHLSTFRTADKGREYEGRGAI
jgi:hypothetical protein